MQVNATTTSTGNARAANLVGIVFGCLALVLVAAVLAGRAEFLSAVAALARRDQHRGILHGSCRNPDPCGTDGRQVGDRSAVGALS